MRGEYADQPGPPAARLGPQALGARAPQPRAHDDQQACCQQRQGSGGPRRGEGPGRRGGLQGRLQGLDAGRAARRGTRRGEEIAVLGGGGRGALGADLCQPGIGAGRGEDGVLGQEEGVDEQAALLGLHGLQQGDAVAVVGVEQEAGEVGLEVRIGGGQEPGGVRRAVEGVEPLGAQAGAGEVEQGRGQVDLQGVVQGLGVGAGDGDGAA